MGEERRIPDNASGTPPEAEVPAVTGIAPIGRAPSTEVDAHSRDGRPADAHKAKCAAIVDDAPALDWAKGVVHGTVVAKEETRLALFKFLYERAHGRLPTVIEGGDAPVKMVFELTRERKDSEREE